MPGSLTPSAITRICAVSGLHLSLTHDDKLKVHPAWALTDRVRHLIKVHKAALVSSLRVARQDGLVPENTSPPSTDGERPASVWSEESVPVLSQEETDRLIHRVEAALGQGLDEDASVALAERLARRDRELDGRRSCFECKSMVRYRTWWKCLRWRDAGLASPDLGRDLASLLQRCPAFATSPLLAGVDEPFDPHF